MVLSCDKTDFLEFLVTLKIIAEIPHHRCKNCNIKQTKLQYKSTNIQYTKRKPTI